VCLCVVYSTPKSYIPPSSSMTVTQTTHTQALEPCNAADMQVAGGAGSCLISYDFISNPAKKAFFESSSPSASAMFDRSDIDINAEAQINQYV